MIEPTYPYINEYCKDLLVLSGRDHRKYRLLLQELLPVEKEAMKVLPRVIEGLRKAG